MSPYQRAADYSSTGTRQRVLWIELDSPPADTRDRYFARVLRNAPDPLISRLGETVPETADPPLAIDAEQIRTIVQDQSDDRAGIDAMQMLAASDSPLHWMLPLPPGLVEDSPELFGFFSYELRVEPGGPGTSSCPASSAGKTSRARCDSMSLIRAINRMARPPDLIRAVNASNEAVEEQFLCTWQSTHA